jgi:hypothetical protein
MTELTHIEHFTPHVGKIFRFKNHHHRLLLERIDSNDRPLPAGVTRRPFLLIFRGPKEREVLPEGLHECEIDGGPTLALYVMPIHTPQPDRQHYQASFN